MLSYNGKLGWYPNPVGTLSESKLLQICLLAMNRQLITVHLKGGTVTLSPSRYTPVAVPEYNTSLPESPLDFYRRTFTYVVLC